MNEVSLTGPSLSSSPPPPPPGINSEVRYSILSGDSSYFSVDEFSGVLRLERALTPDAPDTFMLEVKATDRGLPHHRYSVATVQVNVIPLDEYQPTFLYSEYTLQLPESTEVGSEVLSIAELMNDNLPYRVIPFITLGSDNTAFSIQRRRGR